jgi:hypothetical protein
VGRRCIWLVVGALPKIFFNFFDKRELSYYLINNKEIKMSSRKFYKTIIQVEVLSEDPFTYNSLSDIDDSISFGDCSGTYITIKEKRISGKLAAKSLIAQGSDPEFFMLDKNGKDI